MRHRSAAGTAVLMALAGLLAGIGILARTNGELRRANARIVRADSELRAAHERVIRADSELKAANVRERERFDLAMDAIELFHTAISEDVLLKEKRFEKLRGNLLRTASDFYARVEKMLNQQRTMKQS